jgi:beta-glucanase (GH16 family)
VRRALVLAVLVFLSADYATGVGAQTVPGRGEVLRWADEFTGPRGAGPSRHRWRHEIGERWGNGELQAYTARRANAMLDGQGHLVITARKERHVAGDGSVWGYTSARIHTAPALDFAYGLVEARIRAPEGAGLHAAFWGLGSDLPTVGWPRAGEFDVMEVKGSQPRTVMGSLHGPKDDAADVDASYAVHRRLAAPALVTRGFHVYGLEWQPGKVTFLLDRRPYGELTPADLPPGGRWVYDHPFRLLLTLAVGGAFAGTPTAQTQWPARMVVDWIRVFKEST